MIFRWLRRRRRARLLSTPFPEPWRRGLEDHVSFFASLSAGERERLEGIVRVLVAEKHWEGCAGLALTDEMKAEIAAQAALLILEIDHDYYRGVGSIFVYPSTFLLPQRAARRGLAVETDQPVLGLAHHGGPVVLAWDEARKGALNSADGRNVVFHEFAHKLDLLDAYADGTPVLDTPEHHRAWVRIMTDEFQALARDSARRRATLLDAYGAENPAEFFAVATESFFEVPLPMRRKHPRLYGLLGDYYRQDPAARTSKRSDRS